MTEFAIKITLPANRWLVGTLELLADGTIRAVCPCRGKADGNAAAKARNPGRDPLQADGDTPLGEYAATRIAERHGWYEDDGIGPSWIPLDPIAGPAHMAMLNGRTGLGIHAGRGSGELMATHGCIRLYQSDFDRLREIVAGDIVTRIDIVEGPAYGDHSATD